jgi:hypothetical protein
MSFKDFLKQETEIRKKDAKLKSGDCYDPMDPCTTKASNLNINPDDMPESGPTKMPK